MVSIQAFSVVISWYLSNSHLGLIICQNSTITSFLILLSKIPSRNISTELVEPFAFKISKKRRLSILRSGANFALGQKISHLQNAAKHEKHNQQLNTQVKNKHRLIVMQRWTLANLIGNGVWSWNASIGRR